MTTRSRSLPCLMLVGLLLFVPGSALAGPNEGGTLILHANPGLVFTSDIQNYCGMSALDSCSAAVTSVTWESEKPIVFHVLAAFSPGRSVHDYDIYYTETGRGGGAYVGVDGTGDGIGDWVPVYDPRVYGAPRSVRVGLSYSF